MLKRKKHKQKQSENANKRYQTPANDLPLEVEIEKGIGISSSVFNKNDAHEIFKEKLLANELELEAIGVSTSIKVTPELLKQFHANLVTSSKKHTHYSEYKRHFTNWLPKKPTKNREHGNTTGGKKIGRVSETDIRNFIAENSDPDSSEDFSSEKRA